MKSPAVVRVTGVEGRIHVLRNKRVMLDADLAELYGVQTKNLNKAVKRNRERFPDDFMFQLERALVSPAPGSTCCHANLL